MNMHADRYTSLTAEFRFLSVWMLLVLAGCAAQKNGTVSSSGSSAAEPEYSIIYLLHGDADYLYHNADGEGLHADEEELDKAREMARQASRGEVFIFHQRPERKVLWLFPKKDRRMYHYKNGELVNSRSYSPDGDRIFSREAQLYETHSVFSESRHQPTRQIVLYYGHEIPSSSRKAYYQSRPDVQFGSSEFRKGIAQFRSSSNADPFDLLVLSTCNNGSPDMMQRLEGEADYVLASPQNLHLSHIDSDSLSVLEQDPSISTAALAGKMADQTFERLRTSMQTAVTLSLYDMDVVTDYVTDLAQKVAGQKSGDRKRIGADNVDCRAVLTGGEVLGQGVRVWFKPAAFGRKSTNDSHSGWGCRE